MKIAGKVVDGMNKEPLPLASIVVTDIFYAPLGPGTIADDEGKFQLDTPLLDNQQNLVLISMKGYEELILSPQQANGEVSMKTWAQERDTVFVTAKKRIREIKVNNTWYYVAVAATIVISSGMIYYQVK
jgi:hypothetical protein